MPESANPNPNPADRPSMVTVVVEHAVKPGAIEPYEAWLRRIIPVAAASPGHRGVHILRPPVGANLYTITLKFDSLANAQAWMASDTRRALVTALEPLLDQAETFDTVEGLEFWFVPPAAAPRRARPYKQFLLTLSVIYPLTLLVPWALHPLMSRVPILQPWPVSHLLNVGTVVALLTWIVMPRYTKLVAPWLFR